jgi:cyclic pyranopterin phosphate synthase
VRLSAASRSLHPDLPGDRRAQPARVASGLRHTNGLLLDRCIDALVEAGLRQVTIGFYGTDARYDAYVQRRDRSPRSSARSRPCASARRPSRCASAKVLMRPS